jgi:hypothetical protein
LNNPESEAMSLDETAVTIDDPHDAYKSERNHDEVEAGRLGGFNGSYDLIPFPRIAQGVPGSWELAAGIVE